MEHRDQFVNIQEALNRLGGNMDLYKRLLDKFSETNQVTPLEEALNSGDLDQAIQLAHSIKGVASNLSLNKLADAAMKIELCLKEGEDYSDAFVALKEAYRQTSYYLADVQ